MAAQSTGLTWWDNALKALRNVLPKRTALPKRVETNVIVLDERRVKLWVGLPGDVGVFFIDEPMICYPVIGDPIVREDRKVCHTPPDLPTI